MADADRLVAALNYLQEQKPADPLESFRSLAGLKDAYERRVQPIINNARQTFSTGGAMGDLLRSYGEAAAPSNAAALQGMGIPFKGPMTAPREEGFSSGENFRPMGDPQQQFAGQLLGDPMNVQPMIAPAARGAVSAGKYAGPELARGLENYMGRTGMLQFATDWKASPLVKIGPSGKAGHLSDDVNMFIRELPNGQIEIERSPMWGQSAKPFKIQGKNLEELIVAATGRATKSDTAKAAYEAKKHNESLLGKLQATYGDNFTVSKSERSASQYITHTPSGTKIRVSDHDLPLGYVQPDINLNSGSTVPDQFAEIVRTLGNR